MEVISSEKRHIKFWLPLSSVEQGAVDQAKNLANLPFTFHHVAIMPDTHQGYGMPIGGVLATEGVVIPNAVGVDIGCGMCVCKTGTKVPEFAPILKEFMGKVRELVPVGFNHHSDPCLIEEMPKLDRMDPKLEIVKSQFQKARFSLGTLGGGNHFIEIQRDSEDNIYFMLHSGSRNFGKQIADYYNEDAKHLNKSWHSIVPKEWDLAFLPLDSNEGQAYIAEMNFALEFAKLNRQKMMNQLMKVYSQMLNGGDPVLFGYEDVHHNYATMENHYGKNVMVHRKGATSAKLGEVGIIPGSQGTSSYIVEGLGNAESFMSCSHGAGRKMSRTKAQNELSLDDEIKRMNDKGVVHGIRTKKDLDESAGAYKDIEEVMSNQTDLVKIITKLEPMGVIKG